MLFSILIANFNNGKFFNTSYLSILNQTYPDWKVIIVDDGSNDNSIDVIKGIIGEDKRFKLFKNKKNKGCGYTKNRCANLANGVILGYLDPDDSIKNSALAEMINVHVAHPEVALVTSKYDKYDKQMNFVGECDHASAIPKGYSYLTYGSAALTHFASFKKDFFLKTSGLDIRMKRAVDQDLYFKLEEKGEHLFLDKPLYNYRLHPEGISQSNNVFSAERWHFYAKKKAFNRRRKGVVGNFTRAQFQEIEVEILKKRASLAYSKRDLCRWLYFKMKLRYISL